MNNDLISREALKKALTEAHINRTLTFDIATFGCVMSAIDNAPAVYDNPYSDGREDGYIEGYEEAKRECELQGEWIVTAEDNHGVHRICCPFCHFEKGRENSSIITVTFTKFPNFCEKCGAKLKGGADNVKQ